MFSIIDVYIYVEVYMVLLYPPPKKEKFILIQLYFVIPENAVIMRGNLRMVVYFIYNFSIFYKNTKT